MIDIDVFIPGTDRRAVTVSVFSYAPLPEGLRHRGSVVSGRSARFPGLHFLSELSGALRAVVAKLVSARVEKNQIQTPATGTRVNSSLRVPVASSHASAGT